MAIRTLFPTRIYLQDLTSRKNVGDRLRRELLEQCSLVRDTDPEGRNWSSENYMHGYTSYGSMTDLHRRYPHFQELSLCIDRHVKKFARHLEFDLRDGGLEMTSLWVNIMPQFAAHSWHLHPLSVISGTYYVSLPKGSSGLKFEDPRLSSLMASPPRVPRAKNENQSFVTLHPSPGQVVLWESWLRHEVPPNRADRERVSISFNYEWK